MGLWAPSAGEGWDGQLLRLAAEAHVHAIAAALLDHRRRGDTVSVFTLSHGAVGGDQQDRMLEAAAAAATMGAELMLADLPDTRLDGGVDTIRLRITFPAAPVSLRGVVTARGEVYYEAAAGLVGALRGGSAPYEVVHGQAFFAHLAGDPSRLAAFQASMADRSAREAGAAVAAYDVASFRSVVDVGGGGGVLLRAVRERAPHADLVLFDPSAPLLIDADKLVSRSKNSPFDGRRLQGGVIRTVVAGRSVYSAG